MPTYRGPHVAVTQRFETSPGAVAVESLPPALVGTAYDVFAKEVLGDAYGIDDKEILWGVDNVVYDNSVIGERLYNFYPVTTYADTAFGAIELDSVDVSATGITVEKDDTFKVPDTEVLTGFSNAFIPYYYKNLGAGNVKILATDLQTVIAVGAALSTARLQPGQTVLLGDEATPTSFVNVGTVAAVSEDETKIRLSSAYTGAVSFDTIVVGVAPVQSAGAYINKDRPNCLYDPDADFVAAKVQVGDIVKFQSASLTGEKTATITAIPSPRMIKFNTNTPTAGEEDYDFYRYKTSEETPGSTINVSTYAIHRFIGFSQNYAIKDLNAGAGVTIEKISATSFKVLKTDLAPLLNKGDFIAVTTTNGATPTSYHKIDTVTTDATHQIYTTETTILNEGAIEYSNGEYFHAWNPKVTHDVLADFRAIRSAEQGVVKRIGSLSDITAAWCSGEEISPYNELAYMASITFNASGGKVLYGVNANAAALNLAAEYGLALEELKMYDVYAHALGTTNGGVNALMGAYCDEQSDPYEGHERVAVLVYDEEDVYLQGSDDGVITSSGEITINGGVNLPVAGVAEGDVVKIYNSSGVYQETVNVTATPEAGTPYVCQTDGTEDYSGATMTFKFMSNRREDQANRISALGAGNRRIKVIWPDWFQGDIGDNSQEWPPYYISATAVGLDSNLKASQSRTNRNFAPVGISNITLDTSSYFRKSQLDVIGGGGIDVMIQDGTISQLIRSRHDLTSNMDAIEFREWSITKQVDVTAKTVRAALAPYIGKYNITPSFISFLKQVTAVASNKLVKDGIIADLSIVSIAQDETVVDKINFNLTVTVFVAGNYFDVELLVVSS